MQLSGVQFGLMESILSRPIYVLNGKIHWYAQNAQYLVHFK